MQSDASLLLSRFRASEAFALVAFDELDAEAQGRLARLREDPDFFGLLRPVDSRLPAKSVTRDAALLFLTLRRAQRIPTLLRSLFGDDLTPLHALLADGVLEVESEGGFVSGHAALRFLAPSATARPRPGIISRLSTAAIEYASNCDGLDAAELARKVYAFGRQPCTATLRARFASDADVMSFLTADRPTAALLASRWAPSAEQSGPWLAWTTGKSTEPLGYKLYVSGQIVAMPRLFAIAVRALHRVRCDHFKVGRRAEDLCRPDKMVAYFSSLEQLRECADRIEAEIHASDLAAASAHGVPFTAAIDPAGFLAWGMDPPTLAGVPGPTQHLSWRQWIADRVGVAVVSAQGRGLTSDIVEFVLGRLELDGIDPRTWVPSQSIWRSQSAGAGGVA